MLCRILSRAVLLNLHSTARVLLLSFIDRKTEAPKNPVSYLTSHMSGERPSQGLNPGLAPRLFYSIDILLFRPINAFFRFNILTLKVTKLGAREGQGLTLNHLDSKRQNRARSQGTWPPASCFIHGACSGLTASKRRLL